MVTEVEINEAQRYAENIAAHLYAWKVAAEYIDAGYDGETEDKVTGELVSLREWAELNCYNPEHIADAADIARGELADYVQTVPEAWDLYIGSALCVELIGKHDGSGWTVTGAELTVTAGGPSCWVEWNGSRDWVTVRCAWGSDRGAVVVDCAGLCEAFDRIAGVGV
jgi:hypothetical protein